MFAWFLLRNRRSRFSVVIPTISSFRGRLGVCFFRIYEQDQPAKIEHFFKWSKAGAKDGELNFVSGHPGRTSRLNTVTHLEYLRDIVTPQQLDLLRRREVLISTFSERSLENARRAKDELFGIQNSRKAYLGGLAGLQDPAVMTRKIADERSLRSAVESDPKLKTRYGTAWDEIAKTIEIVKGIRREYNLLERGLAFNTELFSIARTLVRMAEEDAKPNADRLREFGEAGRESLEQQLYSESADLFRRRNGEALRFLGHVAGATRRRARFGERDSCWPVAAGAGAGAG